MSKTTLNQNDRAFQREERNNGSRLGIGERFIPYMKFEEGVWIPDCIQSYPGLTPGEKLVWGRLSKFAGEHGNAYPSYARLGAEIGVNWRRARGFVHSLVRKKFLELDYENLHRWEDGTGGTPRYYFLWHPIFEAGPTPIDRGRGDKSGRKGDTKSCTPGDTKSCTQNASSSNASSQMQSSSSVLPTDLEDPDRSEPKPTTTNVVGDERPKPKPPEPPGAQNPENRQSVTAEEVEQTRKLLADYRGNGTVPDVAKTREILAEVRSQAEFLEWWADFKLRWPDPRKITGRGYQICLTDITGWAMEKRKHEQQAAEKAAKVQAAEEKARAERELHEKDCLGHEAVVHPDGYVSVGFCNVEWKLPGNTYGWSEYREPLHCRKRKSVTQADLDRIIAELLEANPGHVSFRDFCEAMFPKPKPPETKKPSGPSVLDGFAAWQTEQEKSGTEF